MVSSRSLSFLLAGAVHAAVLALAWAAFDAGSSAGPGGGTVVAFRAVDVSAPSQPETKPVRDEKREQVAASASAAMAAPVVRPQMPLSPALPTLLRLSDNALPVPVTPVALAPGRSLSEPAAGSAIGDGAQDGHTAAPPRAASAAATAQGEDVYARRVFAWIARHKGYPARLAREGKEGTALVRLLIDERGRLELAELVRSSGHIALDRLALEQIREAIPYPRPPRGASMGKRQFLVPMSYRLHG